MKRSIQDLLALQKVDLRIRDLENKLRSLPGEKAEFIGEFNVVKKALAAAEKKVKDLEVRIHSIETEIAAKKTYLQNIRLRSDSIKKMSEYTKVMAETNNTNLQISELEEQALNAMAELEQAQADAARAGRSYRATGRMAQKQVLALDALTEEIQKELAERKAESAELEKVIPLSTLPLYKRLLASGKGEPLGFIRNGQCSNCSLTLTPMTLNEARKGNMVACDNCSYFLYDPDL